LKIALVERKSVDRLNIYALVSKMPRGIPLLAAILERSGHSVDCYVECIQDFDWQKLLAYDLVGFSTITCTAFPTYRMIRQLRQAGYKGTIIVGGPHSTALPKESFNAGADVVVRHEGDITLPELLQAIGSGEKLDSVKGISWKNGTKIIHNPDRDFLTEDQLSDLPLPALRTIVGHEKMRQVSLEFARGCPYKCKFCAVESMYGPAHRCSSLLWRINQLKEFCDNYPEFWDNCIVFFSDDNFFGGPRGKAITIAMLNQMKKENLIPPKGWLCQMRVADATLENVRLMREAGCVTVCLGIESANIDTLKAMNKGQTSDDIRIGLGNLHAVGINTLPMTIAGADTDTFWSFWRSIRQLAKWGITYLQTVIMIPLPGTKMTQEFVAEGRQFSPNYDLYNGMHVVLKPKKMSKLGVWMSLYFVSVWFYFFTPNGWRLLRKHRNEYAKVIWTAIRQAIKR
jgi:anaerobic magnesium-protoporphyrin IX monomethyl ester cyclase